jgi:hypothetical protein
LEFTWAVCVSAPEFPSFPLAAAAYARFHGDPVAGVGVPAVPRYVNTVLLPPAKEAVAGLGPLKLDTPSVPSFATSSGATFTAVAPPPLLTVTSTVNACPTDNPVDGNRLTDVTVSDEGVCTVTVTADPSGDAAVTDNADADALNPAVPVPVKLYTYVKSVVAPPASTATDPGVTVPTCVPGTPPSRLTAVAVTLYAVTRWLLFCTARIAVTFCPSLTTVGVVDTGCSHVNVRIGNVFTTPNVPSVAPAADVTTALVFASVPVAALVNARFVPTTAPLYTHVNTTLPPLPVRFVPATAGPTSNVTSPGVLHTGATVGVTPFAPACPLFTTVNVTVNCPPTCTAFGDTPIVDARLAGVCTVTLVVATPDCTTSELSLSVPFAPTVTPTNPAAFAEYVYVNVFVPPAAIVCAEIPTPVPLISSTPFATGITVGDTPFACACPLFVTDTIAVTTCPIDAVADGDRLITVDRLGGVCTNTPDPNVSTSFDVNASWLVSVAAAVKLTPTNPVPVVEYVNVNWLDVWLTIPCSPAPLSSVTGAPNAFPVTVTDARSPVPLSCTVTATVTHCPTLTGPAGSTLTAVIVTKPSGNTVNGLLRFT